MKASHLLAIMSSLCSLESCIASFWWGFFWVLLPLYLTIQLLHDPSDKGNRVLCMYWFENYMSCNKLKTKKYSYKFKPCYTLNHIKLIINPNLTETQVGFRGFLYESALWCGLIHNKSCTFHGQDDPLNSTAMFKHGCAWSGKSPKTLYTITFKFSQNFWFIPIDQVRRTK